MEWLLKAKKIDMSAARAEELTQTMYDLQYLLPDSQGKKSLILSMDQDQKTLYNAIREI
ncbi:MAG: hypothetical protein AB1656_15185 [Candidatus Omnitrophota bacterium]